MSGIGLMEIVPFFVATAICLGLVIMWMVSSESKRNMCKAEIVKLKVQVDTLEKEKMALIENTSQAQSAAPANGRDPADEARIAEDEAMIQVLKDKCEALEKESDSLKTELTEAKSSLEEVYKALVEQAPPTPKKRGRG